MSLYNLVVLDPEELQKIDVAIFHDAETFRLLNGFWDTVPPDVAPDAWIYNADGIHLTDPAKPSILDLTTRDQNRRRFWHLGQRMIGPILASLLHRVSHLAHCESEEIQLAIALRSLLVLRSTGGLPVLGKGTSGNVGDESGKLRGRRKKQTRWVGGGCSESRGQSYGKKAAEIIDRQQKARESTCYFDICILF
jgi:hypothetical protein